MFLFIYKKHEKLLILTAQKSLKKHRRLLEDGYSHISTIDPASYLATIWETVNDEISDQEKVKQITNLLISE